MDADATALERAVAVLRAQFGAQVPGAIRKTQVTMRRALEQQMGLDELAADRLLKQLIGTGRLTYIDTTSGTQPVPDPAGAPTGAVYDIPGAFTPSGAERVTTSATTAGVEATLGGINTVQGHLGGSLPAVDAGLIGARMQYRDDANVRPNPADAAARQAENRTGATMGTLGDTNVASRVTHAETVGEAEAAKDDATRGYWLIR